MVKLINTDATSALADGSSQQLQLDVTGQPTIQSAADDRRSLTPTNCRRPNVRTVDSEPEVVHLLVRENLADDQCTDAELGRVVQLRLETDEQPTNENIQTDSELAKKMIANNVISWECVIDWCIDDETVLNRPHRRCSSC